MQPRCNVKRTYPRSGELFENRLIWELCSISILFRIPRYAKRTLSLCQIKFPKTHFQKSIFRTKKRGGGNPKPPLGFPQGHQSLSSLHIPELRLRIDAVRPSSLSPPLLPPPPLNTLLKLPTLAFRRTLINGTDPFRTPPTSCPGSAPPPPPPISYPLNNPSCRGSPSTASKHAHARVNANLPPPGRQSREAGFAGPSTSSDSGSAAVVVVAAEKQLVGGACRVETLALGRGAAGREEERDRDDDGERDRGGRGAGGGCAGVARGAAGGARC